MATELTVTGTITAIGELQVITERFSKKEFVVLTPGEHGQPVKFELSGKNLDLLANRMIGTSVTVSFNIRGNEHKGTVYNSLQAWKIV